MDGRIIFLNKLYTNLISVFITLGKKFENAKAQQLHNLSGQLTLIYYNKNLLF
jgi:hypothetical protein